MGYKLQNTSDQYSSHEFVYGLESKRGGGTRQKERAGTYLAATKQENDGIKDSATVANESSIMQVFGIRLGTGEDFLLEQ